MELTPIVRGAGAVALAALAVVALAWLFQRRLIYLPHTGDPGPPPAALGAEQVEFPTEDGLVLAGWFVHARGEPNGVTVLVLNGNAGDRSLRAPLADALADAGCAVLLFDYRGYGGNPGRPSERGLLADARAARAYLAARGDVDVSRIAYLGESLGAGVATGLATEQPPVGLVLRSPFTSLADVGRVHYPFLPVALLLRDRYPVAEEIGRVDAPVLVVAGERDRIVPPSQSASVHEAAGGRSRFTLVPGADHNDLALLAGERFVAEVVGFLTEVAAHP